MSSIGNFFADFIPLEGLNNLYCMLVTDVR